jgi:S1-C subfamily serine protease
LADAEESSRTSPAALRLGAVALVAAIVGALVGGGGAYLLVRHYYGGTGSTVTIRTTTGTGSKGTSVSSVLAAVGPSVVGVLREPVAPGPPTADEASDGFVASSTGLIVTSEGAVAGASGVEVVLASGTVLPATIAAADPGTGIVILQVSSPSLPKPLTFASSPALGSAAIAVSLPLSGTVSLDVGTVSEVGLTVEVPDLASSSGTSVIDGVIRTDISEPVGSSGAPVVNASGQVIGTMTGQRMDPLDQGDTAAAFGFALDTDEAAYLVNAIASTGAGPPPIGLVTRWLDAATAASASLPAGAEVLSVAAGSAASSAGLLAGDVVTAVNGTAVQGSGQPRYPDLSDLLTSYGVGAKVTITAVRSGASHQLSLTLPSD